jgi:hypothetical protein
MTIKVHDQQQTIYLRLLFVFVVFAFDLDTPVGLEAFLRCVRVVVAGPALCGLHNSGGGVRERASPVTCDLVFMRLVGAAEVGTFLPPRGGLGLGEDSGVGSRAPGGSAPREALKPRGAGPVCAERAG